MKYFYSLTLGLLLLISSCKKESDIIAPVLGIPTVITHPYSDLTNYSVKISGAIVKEGDSKIMESGFLLDTIPTPTVEKNANKFVRELDTNGHMSVTLTGITDEHRIYIRAYALNSKGIAYGNEIKFTGLPSKSFPGSISLSSQQEVIEFGKNHYTSVGELKITGTVTDLSPLSTIASIAYGLYIRNTTALSSLKGLDNFEAANLLGLFHGMYIENNSMLRSLQGLNKMVAAKGELYIINNDELTDLEGLNSLAYIHFGDLMIKGCEKLKNLNGLEELGWLNGDLVLIDNPQLADIKALRKLNTVTDNLHISNNPSLGNLIGLESLRKVESIQLEDNPLLSDLNGLINVDSIAGLSISNLKMLKSLESLSKISNIDFLTVSDCPSLQTIAGGKIFKSIHGVILRNTGLTSLDGLQNMVSARVIEIFNNGKLTDLQGLNGLRLLEGETYSLLIHSNKKLISLSGLENLRRGTSPTGDGSVQIIDNPSLQDYCGLRPLLASNWFGFFYANGNLRNQSREEIISTCKM